MKDIRRLGSVRFFRFLRRFFAISLPSDGDLLEIWDRYRRAARKWRSGEGGLE